MGPGGMTHEELRLAWLPLLEPGPGRYWLELPRPNSLSSSAFSGLRRPFGPWAMNSCPPFGSWMLTKLPPQQELLLGWLTLELFDGKPGPLPMLPMDLMDCVLLRVPLLAWLESPVLCVKPLARSDWIPELPDSDVL